MEIFARLLAAYIQGLSWYKKANSGFFFSMLYSVFLLNNLSIGDLLLVCVSFFCSVVSTSFGYLNLLV